MRDRRECEDDCYRRGTVQRQETSNWQLWNPVKEDERKGNGRTGTTKTDKYP